MKNNTQKLRLFPASFGLTLLLSSGSGSGDTLIKDTGTQVLPPVENATSSELLSNQQTITVNNIKLIGNTVFSEEQLSPIIQKYENRQLTSNQLQQLRRELTLHYINSGYINSGAVIPDQEVSSGTVTLKIIEGKLTHIDIQNLDSLDLKRHYLTRRIAYGNHGPLNIHQLQQRIKLLHQNALIDRVDATLAPGALPGESILGVQITETSKFQSGINIDNGRSPSVGETRAELWAANRNLSGIGDAVSIQAGTTEGLQDLSLSYTLPVNANNANISLSAAVTESEIIEEPFDLLAITSKNESYSIKYEHPFINSPTGYFKGSVQLDKRTSESFLDGRRQELSNGAKNGTAKVSVIRLGQSWLKKSLNRILAFNSRISIGVDALDATVNPSGTPDGEFINWLGQFQWIQRLNRVNLYFRADAQISGEPLLSLEKFGIGGSNSVRGYRENTFVRDEGWLVSLESRFPVFNNQLQISTFYDTGSVENKDENNSETISSAGLGLIWEPSNNLHIQGYWGYTLDDIGVSSSDTLQDDGVHLSLSYTF